MSSPGNDSAEVVIIGGGIEGCAAAWALTRRGVTDVVVCERDTVGSGGTGKSSGIVRCHYGVSSLAAMANAGLELFESAESILGTEIGFVQSGYVVGVDERNVDALRASMAGQRAVGVRTEEIDHATVAQLWPTADLTPFAAFAWEERGGHGDAYSTAQAFAAAARRAGARIRQGTPVASVLVTGPGGGAGQVDRDRPGAAGPGADGSGAAGSGADGSGAAGRRVVGVRLADGSTIATGTVVVAAGPWSVPLLAEHGIDLPIEVHHEQIVLIDPGPGLRDEIAKAPVFSDLVTLQYVRPESGGQILFGNSDLATLHPADPDNYPNRADEAFLELAVEKISTRFPGLADSSIASTYAGCYDVTPDYNPVISLTPVDGLVVAAGFSGHGFKISPAVGALVADLVVDGHSLSPNIPERDFRLSRFAEGDPLRSPHPYVGAGEMR